MFRKLAPAIARRLSAIREDARPLPAPGSASVSPELRTTVQIPAVSMADLVYGRRARGVA